MINYLETKCEINLLKSRLEILKMQREELEAMVGIQSAISTEIKIQSTKDCDKCIIEYIYRVSKLDEKINQKKIKLKFLENKLMEMEQILRKSSLRHKVFVMKFVEGMKIRDIAKKLKYCERRIQQILNDINKEIKLTF
jgi:histone deacetylase complex regulatory component SIN3